MKWVRRVLVGLVALPVLASVGLLLAGQRRGAGRTGDRLAIARPPADVFHHIEDEALFKKWTGIVDVKSQANPWLQPGARSHMVSEARGQRIEVEVEVTAVERDRRLAFTLRSGTGAPVVFTQAVEYRLEDRDGSTRLIVATETHYEGLVPRLFEPLITRAAQNRLEATLDRLRVQVEAAPMVRRDPKP